MYNRSNISDAELERVYNQGSNHERGEAEYELRDRGYTLDSDTDKWDLPWNQEDIRSTGVPVSGGSVFIMLGIGILIAAVLAIFIGGFIVIAYAVEYAIYIYIGFVITFALMYLTRGNSKIINFLFYLCCLALATRLFTIVIEVFEGVDYVTFITRDSDGLGVIFKYGFLYAIYVSIVPLLAAKLIVKTVRIKRSNFGNKNSTLGN
ncbi:hypothetical protein bcgnr5378_06470 [Bacillus cereus]|uniref:Uncharacterized protein n=1 Tax=Bacillus cereus TaxID=1396 RepID=A0A164LA16_BACCE|nr:hypothetical protein [Bacillus cereus]KZD55591.1 hypothetical protein B4088_5336 [Bacillus cereus]